MNLGRAIRTARAARGMSQQRLGLAMGRDTSLICRIERGDREPSIATLCDISRALEIPVYLLALLASDADDFAGGDARTSLVVGDELLRTLTTRKLRPQRKVTR